MSTDVEMDTPTKTCPRGIEAPHRPGYLAAHDYYRDRGSDGLCCSYCGSLHPDKFIELIKDGAELGPTDKNYKVYVRHPSLRFGKFYFQHLIHRPELREEFTNLLNAQKVKIGVPGYFYVMPFFLTYVTEDIKK